MKKGREKSDGKYNKFVRGSKNVLSRPLSHGRKHIKCMIASYEPGLRMSVGLPIIRRLVSK